MDGTEQRRHREHIVLDDAAVVADEVEYLGLCTTRAVHHTMNLGAQLVKQFLDHRGISTCR